MKEETMKYIDQLAKSLNVASEHVYEALLKQAVVSGIMSIVCAIVMLIVTIALVLVIRKAWIKAEYDPYFDSGDAAMCTFVVGIVLFIVVCVGICAAENGVTALVNPEYWAIKEVLNAIKS
ncbi:hypothetical protein [Macrococcus capreoli]|uniref:hypothetical protein n=1 Tax=Macrococcus capreoli TaxID=2982690 RepID=UPI0021D593A4|nr:hypothetical protein [Macrococcus sp. TMW 2.2395]MCU7556587.1 hypothetical protein [Macrococcus sp. TMW 2.2395]